MKIAFFEVRDREKESLSTLLTDQGNELIFYKEKLDLTNIDKVQNVDIISVFVDSELRPDVVDHLPDLKLIATRSTGFDHIDVKYAGTKNIKVVNVPAYGARTVAELAFGLILTLSRNIYQASRMMKERANYDISGFRGFDLFGKTLGIVGTGRIGKNMAHIAKGFGMKILLTDPFPDEKFAKDEGLEYVSLGSLMAGSDVVTVHAPYSESTHHLINKENIRSMKRGALLINTARGEIVDTDALIWGLNEGIIGGAGLDVLEGERKLKEESELFAEGKLNEHDIKTIAEDHILMDMPNVIITPHIAFFSAEAEAEIVKITVENIKMFAAGSPQNIVETNPPAGGK